MLVRWRHYRGKRMPIDRAQSKKTTSSWSPWIFSPISNNSGSFQETIAVSRILVTGGFLRKKGIHVLVDKGLQKGLVFVTQQQFQKKILFASNYEKPWKQHKRFGDQWISIKCLTSCRTPILEGNRQKPILKFYVRTKRIEKQWTIEIRDKYFLSWVQR